MQKKLQNKLKKCNGFIQQGKVIQLKQHLIQNQHSFSQSLRNSISTRTNTQYQKPQKIDFQQRRQMFFDRLQDFKYKQNKEQIIKLQKQAQKQEIYTYNLTKVPEQQQQLNLNQLAVVLYPDPYSINIQWENGISKTYRFQNANLLAKFDQKLYISWSRLKSKGKGLFQDKQISSTVIQRRQKKQDIKRMVNGWHLFKQGRFGWNLITLKLEQNFRQLSYQPLNVQSNSRLKKSIPIRGIEVKKKSERQFWLLVKTSKKQKRFRGLDQKQSALCIQCITRVLNYFL